MRKESRGDVDSATGTWELRGLIEIREGSICEAAGYVW